MSSAQDTSVFDLFSIVQAEPQECHILTVKVLQGRNISLGYLHDCLDTPDPYVKLHIPGGRSLCRSTTVVDNNINPEWNETFEFILNPSTKNILNLELWDSDYNDDDFIASQVYDLDNVQLGVTTKATVTFVGEMTVDLELTRTLSFDPFSIFQAKPQECHMLTVKVIQGRNISLGYLNDCFDTPDPYMKLYVPEARSLHRSTKVVDNNINPKWNETFVFILNPSTRNTLNLELWDYDYNDDDFIASQVYDLDNVQLGVTTKATVTFVGEMTVELELTRTWRKDADIRLGVTLCNEEKKFVNDRKQEVLKAMQEAFGAEGPQHLDEVPVIGVMGSGGGFRAMTGFCGALSALTETGVFDMTTYLAGLSGSSWYMGHLYSHPQWPNKVPKQLQQVLKNYVTQPWFKKTFSYSFIKRLIKLFQDKKKRSQPLSLTDLYGLFIGEILLEKEMDGYLSDQTKKVDKANVPLPIYTAVRVKPNTSANMFSEWMEFSPYEISMPKYGVSLKPQLFNSKFHLGRVEELLPEPNLHFLLGMFGSAFAILFKRLMRKSTGTTTNTVEENRPEGVTDTDSDESDDEEEQDLNLAKLEHEALQKPQSDDRKHVSDLGQGVEEETHKALQKPQSDDTKHVSDLGQGMEEETHKAAQKPQSDDKEHVAGLGQGVINSLKLLLSSKAFNGREGRAAKVFNFCSGMDVPASDAFSPFSSPDEADACMDKKMPAKHSLYVVDAGLSINLPAPPLLRPQRYIDLIISFDFSERADGVCPLKELRKSEAWAKARGVPFPPISISSETVQKEGVKECYVFKHPEDDHCPIVIHFVLVNDTFKAFKSPGEPRVTPEEKDFGDFSIFEDDEQPYRTMNFTYTNKSFERIVQLMSYNTLNHKEEIFDAIKECIGRRRQRSQEAGVSWDVLKVVSQAAKNFHKLDKKKSESEVCPEGLKQLEDLITNTLGGPKVNEA